jgi:hypothetical protein
VNAGPRGYFGDHLGVGRFATMPSGGVKTPSVAFALVGECLTETPKQ